MKRKDAAAYLWVLVIPLLLIALGYPAFYMPGRVISAHADFEGSCHLCHERWKGALPRLCLDCHSEIDTASHGLECARCHPEHRGRSAKATGFDHDRAGYTLSPGHASLGCGECHSRGYVGTSTETCISCHETRSMEGFNSTEHFTHFKEGCLECHRGPETDVSGYSHGRTGYDLPDRFKGLGCRDCHPAGFGSFNHSITGYETSPAHSDTGCGECHETGFKGFSTKSCISCHEQPRTVEGFNMTGHIEVFTDQCLGCHGKAGFDPSGFDHSRTGYVIDKHHLGLGCRDCHRDGFAGTVSCNPAGCHRQSKLEGEHLEHGITDYLDRSCLECHISKERLKGFKKPKGKRGDDD